MALLALTFKGDNVINQEPRKNIHGLTSQQQQTVDTWKYFSDNINLEEYLRNTDPFSFYSKGLLSQDYLAKADSVRRGHIRSTTTNVYLDSYIEMRENEIAFLETNNLENALRALAAGYTAMLVSPNGMSNKYIVARMERICSQMDSLRTNPPQ